MTYKGMGNTQMINPYARTDEEKEKICASKFLFCSNN